VARGQSGVPASTLRFYDEKGLIASTGRRGLRRLFDPGVLERLALIALGRAAGFSLDEIARRPRRCCRFYGVSRSIGLDKLCARD
jgi:DNA-binding transcriptional MerR regulator